MNGAAERLQMELSLYGIEPVSVRGSVLPGRATAKVSIPSDTKITGQVRCIRGGIQKLLRSPDTLNDQVIMLDVEYNDLKGERYVAESIDKAYYHLPDLLHDLGLIPNTNN